MDCKPCLSVVVPVHNRVGIVGRTLDSIASQDHLERAEIILVDNVSTDGSVEILDRWADDMRDRGYLVTVLSQPKSGAAPTRNRGLEHASAPWVSFFDSDDTMLPGFITAVTDAIEANPEADILGWDIEYVSEHTKRLSPFAHEHHFWNHLIHATLCTLHYAVRTDFVRAAGGWCEDIRQWDDYELGVRMLLRSPRIVNIDSGVLAQANFTVTSLTGINFSRRAGRWERVLDMVEKQLRDAGRSTYWVDVRRVILAGEYHNEGRHDLASQLMRATTAHASSRRNVGLWLLYAKHCLYPRGTGRVAAMFHSKKV